MLAGISNNAIGFPQLKALAGNTVNSEKVYRLLGNSELVGQ
jgi:hypothetical protein